MIHSPLKTGLAFCFWGVMAMAQAQTGINCDVLRFQTLDASFIEVHVEFEGSLFRSSPGPDGWQTEVQIEAVVHSADGIVNYGKTNVLGPASIDSLSAIAGTQFHLERIEAPSGVFNVTVTISDSHPESNFQQELNLPVQIAALDQPTWSDPFIVEAFAPSDEELTMLSRSGYEMLPITHGEIVAEAEKIQFYCELYNVHEVVDSMFLVSCWIEDVEGQVLPGTRRFFRKVAAPILPLFTSIPMPEIGEAKEPVALVVQALTRENQLIAENRLPFQLVPTAALDNRMDYVSALPAYLQMFTDSLTLLQHIQDHHPLADASQRHTINGAIKTAPVDQMQAFLAHFWEQHSPESPELGWRDYTKAIAYADSSYGACRNGHGAETDMGYIYLRYGPPNTVVKRHNETDYYPYEIWHYHRAGPFTNKRFLFFSPHMVAECFTILHSDMLGEVQNSDWLHQLRNRENRLRVTDSQLNRLNPRRDTFSGEEPEDLFFNPR